MHVLTPFFTLARSHGLGHIAHLAFSAQGTLAIGCNRRVLLWDVSQQPISAENVVVACTSRLLTPLCWSPEGDRLALSTSRGTALYDLAARKIITQGAQDGATRALAWSPDGLLACCSEQGVCQLWQPATHQLLTSWHAPLPADVLVWLPGGRLAMKPFAHRSQSDEVCAYWQVHIWDAQHNRVVCALVDGEQCSDNHICAALSPTAPVLAVGTDGGWVQYWHLAEQGATRTHHLPFHAASVQSLAWSPDGAYLLSGAQDGHGVIWNRCGEPCFHLTSQQHGGQGIQAVAWWRDLLAVADDVGHIALYRLPQPKTEARPFAQPSFQLLR